MPGTIGRSPRKRFFEPVQPLISFEDEEDAIRITNHSVYGLSARVFSGDAPAEEDS
jgi:acyl-CoA reductase-like NAD-dependent aldehyde dehydrogenase